MELLMSGVVLVSGFLGVMALITGAIASNGRNKMDTTSAALAQMVLERVSQFPANSSSTTSITDCAGSSWTISAAAGGAPLLNGAVDFTQTSVSQYSMQYAVCDAAGRQTTYDVRWNVAAATTHTTLVTVSARPGGAASGNRRFFALPVTLSGLVGQ